MNWFKRILIELLFALFFCIAWTARFSFSGRFKSYHLNKYKASDVEASETDSQSSIILFWHNQLLVVLFLLMIDKLPRRSMSIMISSSRDGDFLAYLCERLGCSVIRGSAHKRGIQALKEIHKSIKGHRHIAYAADGPTGPIYKMKPGAVFLSNKYKIPLLLIRMRLEWCTRLRSWDKLIIPLPFAKIEVDAEKVFPEAIFENASDSEKESLLEEGMLFVEEKLNNPSLDVGTSFGEAP